MQLKVCNPHLSFFDSVSLDEECDETLRSGDRCKFIKGFKSRRGFKVVFHTNTKEERKQLQLVYMNCEIIVQQNIHQQYPKAFLQDFFSF